MMTSSGVTTERIMEWYEAWNRRDETSLGSFLHPGFAATDHALGRIAHDRHEQLKNAREFWRAFPDGKIKVQRVLGSGNGMIFVEYTLSGTQLGVFGLFPASRRKAEFHFCDILKLENAKLIELTTYGDMYKPLAQLEHIMTRNQPSAA